jgi:F0F1-type ATP synthase membrane subunit b/b'
MVTRAEEEIRRDQAQAMVALREQVVALTLGATQKILGESLDESRQRRLIDNFITEQVPAAPAPAAATTQRYTAPDALEA